jgi:hypothetical protein
MLLGIADKERGGEESFYISLLVVGYRLTWQASSRLCHKHKEGTTVQVAACINLA